VPFSSKNSRANTGAKRSKRAWASAMAARWSFVTALSRSAFRQKIGSRLESLCSASPLS
jgi:hypothetical protein